MIKVWTDAAEAGLLDRQGERGSTFAYLPHVPAGRAVSVTMPVRLPTWSVPFGLPPIFEMNLPEGVLRERLRLAFAKATGAFDEFDLLSIVGRSQVGRIRYTGDNPQGTYFAKLRSFRPCKITIARSWRRGAACSQGPRKSG
jgi:serine/threonine-protein kinase HipA